MIWANLLHLSYNMWCDRSVKELEPRHICYKPYLRFSQPLWDEILVKMARAGMNMVIIDVVDGIEYASHPEISVRDAWSAKKLRVELAKIRDLGMEPIPKLNMSTAHDAWMGPYSRCVSTDAYYAFCRDVIEEVADLFGHPRLFHLGMDEEVAQHQRHYEYAVMRQHDLWWHDLYFFIKLVEKANARPWVWSDYLWHYPEVFWKKMPRSVLQSNWYYRPSFSKKLTAIKAYTDLEKHRYDQVPTGSNWNDPVNFPRTVNFCRREISPQRLLGFMQAPWHPTLACRRDRHIQTVEITAEAIQRWNRYR